MGRSRPCKNCGVLINLRKMPHGKYVAFEGYEIQHKCSGKMVKISPGKTAEYQDFKKANTPVQDLKVKQENILDSLTFSDDIPHHLASIQVTTKTEQHIPETKREKIVNAITNQHVLRIRYESVKDVLWRDIEPLSQNDVHCYAYCRLRKDFRSFRISGMLDIKILQEQFQQRITPPVITPAPPPETRPYYYESSPRRYEKKRNHPTNSPIANQRPTSAYSDLARPSSHSTSSSDSSTGWGILLLIIFVIAVFALIRC